MPHARAWWLPCVGRRPTGGRRGDRGRPGQPRAGGGVERRRGPGLGRAGRSLRGERGGLRAPSPGGRNSRPPTSCSTWVAAPVHPRAAAQRAARGRARRRPLGPHDRRGTPAGRGSRNRQCHVRAGRRAGAPSRSGAADVVMSKFGAMFFADADAAFTNLARASGPTAASRCSGGAGSATTTGCGWCATLAAGRDLPVPPHGAPGPFGRRRRATAPSWKAPASSTSRTSSCTSRLRPATPPTTRSNSSRPRPSAVACCRASTPIPTSATRALRTVIDARPPTGCSSRRPRGW